MEKEKIRDMDSTQIPFTEGPEEDLRARGGGKKSAPEMGHPS